MSISENSKDTTSSVVTDNNTTITYNIGGDRDKIRLESQNEDANPNSAQVYAKIDITLHTLLYKMNFKIIVSELYIYWIL